MNPIVTGWYADPEVRFYEGRCRIYVTKSFTAYIHRAAWAPAIIDKDGKHCLIFASNDIRSNIHPPFAALSIKAKGITAESL